MCILTEVPWRSALNQIRPTIYLNLLSLFKQPRKSHIVWMIVFSPVEEETTLCMFKWFFQRGSQPKCRPSTTLCSPKINSFLSQITHLAEKDIWRDNGKKNSKFNGKYLLRDSRSLANQKQDKHKEKHDNWTAETKQKVFKAARGNIRPTTNGKNHGFLSETMEARTQWMTF